VPHRRAGRNRGAIVANGNSRNFTEETSPPFLSSQASCDVGDVRKLDKSTDGRHDAVASRF